MAQQPRNMIDQIMDPKKFDRRTHIWDSQGRLIKKNLYTEYVQQGERYLERPMNSGNLWTEGNQPAGRVEKTFGKDGQVLSKKFDYSAAHKEFSPVLTGDDALMYQLEQERAARTELENELAAIRAERSPADVVISSAPEKSAAIISEPKLRKGT